MVCSSDKITLGLTSTWRKASATNVNYSFKKVKLDIKSHHNVYLGRNSLQEWHTPTKIYTHSNF